MSDGRLPAQRRWIQWLIGAVVTFLVLAVGWVLIRGVSAASELQNVSPDTTRADLSCE